VYKRQRHDHEHLLDGQIDQSSKSKSNLKQNNSEKNHALRKAENA